MNEKIIEAAIKYIEAGLTPVPVHGIDDNGNCTCKNPVCGKSTGKHPIMNGWQKKLITNVEDVQARFSFPHPINIGLHVGPNLIAFDIDSKEGWEHFAEYQPPETLAATSGSGNGGHRFFYLSDKHDRARLGNDVKKRIPGVDIRQGDGLVIVEPSTHASGGVYTWDNWGVSIAELPENLYEACKKPIGEHPFQTPAANNVVSIRNNDMKRARAYMEKIPIAIEGSYGHNDMFAACRRIVHGFRDMALTDGEKWELLLEYNSRCKPPFSKAELMHKWDSATKDAIHRSPVENRPNPLSVGSSALAVESVPVPAKARWIDQLIWTKTKTGEQRLQRLDHNLIMVLEHYHQFAGCIRKNTASGTVEAFALQLKDYVYTGEITDHVVTLIKQAVLLLSEYSLGGQDFPEKSIIAAINVVAERNKYNPITEYLKAISWDGQKRLDNWLCTYFGCEDTPWNRTVGRKFMIGAAMRGLQPGCKMDTCIVFEGEQGFGKSMALKALFSEQYFIDSPIRIDRDLRGAYTAIRGKWGCEIAELKFTDASQLKSFLSSATDTYVGAYAKRAESVPRQTVFIGSTNDSSYLTDETGNRRFWPVKAGRVNPAAVMRDRDQLWAEAVAAVNAGEKWWLTEEEDVQAVVETEQRVVRDPIFETIEAYLQQPRMYVTVREILSSPDCLMMDPGRQTRSDVARVQHVLKDLGWIRVQGGGQGKQQARYRKR